MALKTTLQDIKSRLNALITYANGITGENDTNIGDAIETLCTKYTDEEDWDFILYPIENNPDYIFNAKHIDCVEGSTIIIEFVGCGRVLAVYGKTDTFNDIYFPKLVYRTTSDYTNYKSYFDNNVVRYTIENIPYTSSGQAKLVFAGYEWSGDNAHSSTESYQFRGQYMKVKIITPTK